MEEINLYSGNEKNETYLKEFYEKFHVLKRGELSKRNKAKINYYFSVPLEELEEIRDLEKLEKIINKHKNKKSEADKDFMYEVKTAYEIPSAD